VDSLEGMKRRRGSCRRTHSEGCARMLARGRERGSTRTRRRLSASDCPSLAGANETDSWRSNCISRVALWLHAARLGETTQLNHELRAVICPHDCSAAGDRYWHMMVARPPRGLVHLLAHDVFITANAVPIDKEQHMPMIRTRYLSV
jgi:hypothetical protein